MGSILNQEVPALSSLSEKPNFRPYLSEFCSARFISSSSSYSSYSTSVPFPFLLSFLHLQRAFLRDRARELHDLMLYHLQAAHPTLRGNISIPTHILSSTYFFRVLFVSWARKYMVLYDRWNSKPYLDTSQEPSPWARRCVDLSERRYGFGIILV